VSASRAGRNVLQHSLEDDFYLIFRVVQRHGPIAVDCLRCGGRVAATRLPADGRRAI